MNFRRIRFVAMTPIAGIVVALLSGCASLKTEKDIEDYFSQYGIIVEHHAIVASGTLKDSTQWPSLLRAMRAYMAREPAAPEFHYSSRATGEVRPRDFCASFLAGYYDIPLEIFTWESHAQRDRKIDALQKELPPVAGLGP